jgi:hypothetical protein
MLSDKRCPYRDADDSWKNDPDPLELGDKFAPFFGFLVEIERATA